MSGSARSSQFPQDAPAPAPQSVPDATRGAGPSDAPRVAIVAPQKQGGLALLFRVADDQRLYRLAPIRDPRQPRFWGLAVFTCLAGGTPELGPAIWAGCWGTPRNELAGALAQIREDADRWLAAEQRAGLRALLRAPASPAPLPPSLAPRGGAGRAPGALPATPNRPD